MDTIVAAVAGRVFALLGLIGALTLFLAFSKVPDQQSAADQLDVTATRAQQWLLDNFAQRVADTNGGMVEYVPTTNQAADPVANIVFPATYQNRNVYGQTHVIKVWQATPGATPAQLYALVQTCNGDTIAPSEAARAAGLAHDAGVVSVLDPSTVTSAAGSWSVPTATVNSADCPATPGHLATLIQIDGGQVTPPFVHRYKVGSDPEPNTMHTSLYMGDQTIENASDVKLTNGKWLSSAVMDMTIVPDGTVISKPSCPHGTPRIYAAPAAFADDGAGRPIVSVQARADDNGATWTVRIIVYVVNSTGTGSVLVPPGPNALAQVSLKCE